MFSPDAFSGYGFGSGAPSADSSGGPGSSQATGPQTISAEQAAANVALAQALTGGGLSQAAIAEQQDYNDAVQAQEFNSMRDAEAGRLHADSLTGVPFAGGITVMRNAAGRPMGPQTIAANLPLGAGTLAQQIMTQNTLVQPDDGFGFNGPLSTGSLDSQPSFDNPDMDMISVPSQEEMAAAQVAQAPTPGVAGAPQAFGSPGSYDERRAQFGFGDINTDPVREHNARLMRAALGG